MHGIAQRPILLRPAEQPGEQKKKKMERNTAHRGIIPQGFRPGEPFPRRPSAYALKHPKPSG
jgi:hypothetical protein